MTKKKETLKDKAHRHGLHEEAFKKKYYEGIGQGMSKEEAENYAVTYHREKGNVTGIELAEIAYKYQGVKLV